MRVLAILGLSVLAAVLYGIAHDQVTTRVCLEYFTVFHAPVFGTESPTLLAFGWGVIATWWMGLFLGFPLALAARAGRRPKWTARQLVRPIAVLLATMAVLSLIAGILGYLVATRGWIRMPPYWAERIPRDRHTRFLADLAAHNMAYASGFVGGWVVCGWVWWRRGREARGIG